MEKMKEKGENKIESQFCAGCHSKLTTTFWLVLRLESKHHSIFLCTVSFPFRKKTLLRKGLTAKANTNLFLSCVRS